MSISPFQAVKPPLNHPRPKAVRFGMATQQPSQSPEPSLPETTQPDRFQSTTPGFDSVPLSKNASILSFRSESPYPPEQQKKWSYLDKAKGAITGAFKQARHDFSANFKHNVFMSCVITLATCWLPGSQLFTIPLWFCVDSAISMARGASRGWENPDFYASKQAEERTATTKAVPLPIPVG